MDTEVQGMSAVRPALERDSKSCDFEQCRKEVTPECADHISHQRGEGRCQVKSGMGVRDESMLYGERSLGKGM